MQIISVAFIAISLCVFPSVRSLTCLNGKEVKAENGTVIVNDALKPTTCDSSEVTKECHRYDVVFTIPSNGSGKTCRLYCRGSKAEVRLPLGISKRKFGVHE